MGFTTMKQTLKLYIPYSKKLISNSLCIDLQRTSYLEKIAFYQYIKTLKIYKLITDYK